jgi:hypothetical protein
MTDESIYTYWDTTYFTMDCPFHWSWMGDVCAGFPISVTYTQIYYEGTLIYNSDTYQPSLTSVPYNWCTYYRGSVADYGYSVSRSCP